MSSTLTDRRRARRALEIYTEEFVGNGLRYIFDGQPGESMIRMLERLLDRSFMSSMHVPNRLRRSSTFVGLIRGFSGKRVWLPEGVDPHRKTVEITAIEVGTYKRIRDAVAKYVKLAHSLGPGSLRTEEAAYAVAYTINPEAWRRNGVHLPRSWVSYRTFDTQLFLETVVYNT